MTNKNNINSLGRFLNPKNVVVIGGGVWGKSIVFQLKKMDFSGQIFAVHPSEVEFCGCDTYRNISDLPSSIDAAFVGVNRIATVDIISQLIKVCNENKEIKLKYELEKNVNLVSFEKNRIEISFNDNLDKNFVKDLSLKLFEWTGERWIIAFSKVKGEISVKEKEKIEKIKIIDESKNSELYKAVLEKFEDASLVEVISKKKGLND